MNYELSINHYVLQGYLHEYGKVVGIGDVTLIICETLE